MILFLYMFFILITEKHFGHEIDSFLCILSVSPVSDLKFYLVPKRKKFVIEVAVTSVTYK